MSETDPFYSEESDGMSKRTQLEEFFSQSLEVELLLRLCPDDEDTIYQIVDLLVDTCATNRKLLRIAGDGQPDQRRSGECNDHHVALHLQQLHGSGRCKLRLCFGIVLRHLRDGCHPVLYQHESR